MYFPKSQITTDLYTNGREFIYLNSNTEYIGYYFETSTGKYYTGRNPNDLPVQELVIPTSDKSEDAEEGVGGSYTQDATLYLVPDVYARALGLRENDSPPSIPIQHNSLPTEENYELGEYQRYFASKINEIKYIEINFDQYEQFLNEEPNVDYFMYRVFSLPWLITGKRNDVFNINKKTVERTQTRFTLQGLTSYFQNRYDQYFKYTPGENLNTNGTEFLDENGKPYIGLYHIHPSKGPMVGAQHTKIPHSYLTPISGSNREYKINKIETQISSTGSRGYSGGY